MYASTDLADSFTVHSQPMTFRSVHPTVVSSHHSCDRCVPYVQHPWDGRFDAPRPSCDGERILRSPPPSVGRIFSPLPLSPSPRTWRGGLFPFDRWGSSFRILLSSNYPSPFEPEEEPQPHPSRKTPLSTPSGEMDPPLSQTTKGGRLHPRSIVSGPRTTPHRRDGDGGKHSCTCAHDTWDLHGQQRMENQGTKRVDGGEAEKNVPNRHARRPRTSHGRTRKGETRNQPCTNQNETHDERCMNVPSSIRT